MSQIKPHGNRVLIKRKEAQMEKGGILLPESAKEKPKEGTVIATGPGKRNDDGTITPLSISVGDTVLFSSYAGTEIKDQAGDEEFLILSEDDILGVLNS